VGATVILLTRDFSAAFDGSFDVGLTYRNGPSLSAMPVNEGIIVGAQGNAPALKTFFDDVLDIYEWLAAAPSPSARYGFDIRNWRGGQLSLAGLIDWTVPPQASAKVVINKVRYKFLPCFDFNYTVTPSDPPQFLATRWAIHFKGAKAKGLMAPYVAFTRKMN